MFFSVIRLGRYLGGFLCCAALSSAVPARAELTLFNLVLRQS